MSGGRPWRSAETTSAGDTPLEANGSTEGVDTTNQLRSREEHGDGATDPRLTLTGSDRRPSEPRVSQGGFFFDPPSNSVDANAARRTSFSFHDEPSSQREHQQRLFELHWSNDPTQIVIESHHQQQSRLDTTIITTTPNSSTSSSPTLIPGTSSRDTRQAPRFSGSGIDIQSQSQLASSGEAASLRPPESLESRPLTLNATITTNNVSQDLYIHRIAVGERERPASNSVDQSSLSSPTMGYKNSPNQLSAGDWNNRHDSNSDKMQEPTNGNNSSHAEAAATTTVAADTCERNDQHDDDSVRSIDSNHMIVTTTSAVTPLAHQQRSSEQDHQEQQQHTIAGTLSASGTPSTVSTAPSTDAEYVGLLEPSAVDRLALTIDSAYPEGTRYHRRVQSWEVSPQAHSFAIMGNMSAGAGTDFDHAFPNALPPAYAPAAWAAAGQHQQQHQQQRVASFRGGADPQHGYGGGGFPPMQPPDTRWQHQRFGSDAQQPFLPQPLGRGGQVDNRLYRQQQQDPFHSYPVQQQQQQQHPPHHQLSGGYAQPPLPPSNASTPPRNVRHPRLAQSPHRPPQGSPGSGGGGMAGVGHMGGGGAPTTTGGGNARSTSEVLKTLLRKKACLYEPDTSRAVALITWLVGRELALEYGFFSRQQLQAGVHSCVATKIESGAITRTKVNRCMQIILNSCFHYIIPRPDGSEENGNMFRGIFETEVEDDSFLLQVLPMPWSDLIVDREGILEASAAELEVKVVSTKKSSPANTPKNSPRLAPVDKASPGRESVDDEHGDHKRAVLLCFNENVRCAEDVFRCHNEFIRDTAHASHLQMSSQEWRLFFGQAAASARYLWGNVGIPVPHSESHGGPMQTDALGMMTDAEAAKFRSCWCTKRYDHNHDFCGFAHAEINGGWLRRNILIHNYKDEMCTYVSKMAPDKRGSSSVFFLNECPHGVDCDYAHSMEEVVYHPKNYKTKPCPSLSRQQGGCHLGDVCPNFHPAESYRFAKKSDGRGGYGARHSKQTQHGAGGKGALATLPAGSPVLYASPAPVSSFEHNLALPGLQNLFRRHCSVVRAYLRTPGDKTCTCCYSYFGDDVGVNVDLSSSRSGPTVGLPQPIRA